jgi:hypothetical protein
VDILPSTRKRISSGCAGNGRTAVTFLGSFDRDFRDEDFAFFVTRGFCGDRRVGGLPDFGLRLRGAIRLYLLRRWPGVAASISKRIEDPAVEAAQNVAHQIECAIGEEIGAVNVSDALLEEARAIHVPNVICW